MSIFSDLFDSRGAKRTVASIFAVAATVADFVPALTPYKELLLYLGGFFGAVGVGHAAVSK